MTNTRRYTTRVGRLLAAAARRDAEIRTPREPVPACPSCGRFDLASGDICAYCGERLSPAAPPLEWRCAACGHVEPVEAMVPAVAEGDVQECTECEDGEAVAVAS